MGWGTGNLGGGSGELNFKVVGGTTAPSNPKENMIWVDTDVKITNWIFSANEPENPNSGTVWISTGSSSTVAFNALKKNGIQVYPLSAKQYVSGAWVDVTAMSYQGGEWVAWYGVPSEYQRIEYLEASGTQWINTNAIHVADTEIEAEFYAYSAPVNDYESLFGARNHSYSKNALVFYKRFYEKNVACFNRSGKETEGTGFVYNTKIKILISGKVASYYSEDTLLGSITTGGTADNGTCPMFLFNTNISSTANGATADTAGSKARLYSFKMWNNGELIRDFIPCYRKSDNVAGLWDCVNRTFYTNEGTGTFIVGEAV